RGPEFGRFAKGLLTDIRKIFQTEHPVVIYPSSGTGAWEAALVNLFQPGDRLLMVETGQFATLWRELAERLGYEAEFIPGDWRHGVDPAAVEARLKADGGAAIKAVCMVHNETS
ncbi:MAG: aminotransferase class V-fold PLP-dependent enzyme, partial [Alphaproteobacteria bacterium]